MSTLAHEYDMASGGCVCGSGWFPAVGCEYVVADFGAAWLAAQEHWTVAAYADYDGEPWECSHGHDRCSRH